MEVFSLYQLFHGRGAVYVSIHVAAELVSYAFVFKKPLLGAQNVQEAPYHLLDLAL